VTYLCTVCLKTTHSTTFLVNIVAVYYFKCVGLPLLFMFLICTSTYAATLAIGPSILRIWSESGGLHMWFYMGMYGLSSLLAFASTTSVIW
jgi:ATP-binding cassette subfamily C (CFTR/MRP) protein 1